MKKLLFALLLIGGPVVSFCQTTPKEQYQFAFANLLPAEMKPGSAAHVNRKILLQNPKFSGNVQVVSFSVSIMPKGKDLIGPYTAYGNALPKQIIDALPTCQPGKLIMESIKVKTKDGTIRTFNPVAINFD
jgi:hypothetical protein